MFGSRRDFLKTLMISSFAWPVVPALGQTREDCEAKLRDARVHFQESLAEERALLFKLLIARYGSGVLNIVREYTTQDARQKSQRLTMPKHDLETVLEILWKQAVGLLDYEIEKQTPEFLKLRVSACVFAEAMRKHDASDIGAAFYCAYDYGFCEGFNPNLEFARTRTLMEGHGFCDHTYMLKKASIPPHPGFPAS